jgi:hypothetical protein
MPDTEKLGQLAQDFCEHHSLPHSDGWVLFWQSEPFAWSARLSPEHYRPGVLALSSDGSLLMAATGGDDDSGARGFSLVTEVAP